MNASETKNAHIHVPKVLSRSPTESTRNTRKSTALETARTRDRAVALEISVRVAVPRRSSALPPARRTSVHAELTTSSQTTFVRDESSLREPRDATIVTCLASPPKRHRTIRHALRWHETAQGTYDATTESGEAREGFRETVGVFTRRPSARRTLGRPRVARGSPFPRDRPDASRRSAVNSAARRIPSRQRREDARRLEPRGTRGSSGASSRVCAPRSASTPRARFASARSASPADHRRRTARVRAPRNRRPAPATCRRRRFPRLSAVVFSSGFLVKK